MTCLSSAYLQNLPCALVFDVYQYHDSQVTAQA